MEELNELRKIAESATPGPWEAEPYLLSRLEQAERNADTYQTLYEQRAESLTQAELVCAKLRNRLVAMRRQRDGDRNQLRKTEQQVERVREFLEYRKANSAVARDGLLALDGEPNE